MSVVTKYPPVLVSVSIIFTGMMVFCCRVSAWPEVDYILQRMVDDLELTSEQVDQVRPIIQNNMAMRDALIQEITFGETSQGVLLSKEPETPEQMIGIDPQTSLLLDQDLYDKLSEFLTFEQMNEWRLLAAELRNM